MFFNLHHNNLRGSGGSYLQQNPARTSQKSLQ